MTIYIVYLHRWIILHLIIIFHVANAQQPDAPSPYKLQTGQNPSKATVLAVLITVFFLIGILSVYIRWIRNESDSSVSQFRFRRDWSRRGGLDDAVFESFPVFAYSSVKESKIGSGDLECAICLNEFEDQEIVRLLPICNHLFHIECIDTWLYSHTTCPVCRSNLTPKSDKIDPPIQAPVTDQVAIDISETVEEARSYHRRQNFEIANRFPRSNSTGHSIARVRDGADRYTLRLPDEVKKRIMAVKGRRLKRTRSFEAHFMVEDSNRDKRRYDRSGE